MKLRYVILIASAVLSIPPIAHSQFVTQVANSVAVGGIAGLGTGVATALGLAVGSAGAPVTNGGALGTPSSGVATNLTGTASGLTAGNVTTNANLTGDVTSSGNATTLAAGSASNLNSGTLAAARGGTGVSNSANTTVTSAVSIGKGQFQGTSTNDAATAGNIGERIDGTAALQSVPLTSNTAANTGSATLTAGDWEVTCHVAFLPAATTTVTNLTASLSATSATNNGTLGFFGAVDYPATVLGSGQYTTMTSPPARVSLSGSTIYYCVALAAFGVSTMTAGGSLHAVRVR